MRPALAAAVLVLATGCSILDPGRSKDLRAARRQWDEAAIASYRLTVHRSCFCAFDHPSGVRITVVNGTVESRIDVATGQPIPPQSAPYFPDVPGLFELIERTIDHDPAGLAVDYDPDTGYPRRIVADPIGNAIDDEFTVTAVLSREP
jgi:hypothetical protein